MLSGRRKVHTKRLARLRRRRWSCCQRRWTLRRSTVASWVARSLALPAWMPSTACGTRTLHSSFHETASPWVATAHLRRWQSSVLIQRCLWRWVDVWDLFTLYSACLFCTSPWVATARLRRWQSSVLIQRCLWRWVDLWDLFTLYSACLFCTTLIILQQISLNHHQPEIKYFFRNWIMYVACIDVSIQRVSWVLYVV